MKHFKEWVTRLGGLWRFRREIRALEQAERRLGVVTDDIAAIRSELAALVFEVKQTLLEVKEALPHPSDEELYTDPAYVQYLLSTDRQRREESHTR